MSPQIDKKKIIKFHAQLPKWELMYLVSVLDFLPFLSLLCLTCHFVCHLRVLPFSFFLSVAWLLSCSPDNLS